MAANTATGLITSLFVGSTVAKVFIDDEEDNVEEAFILFTDPDGVVPDRVAQSMWLSLCRDAVLTGKRINVFTVNQNSAQLSSITLLPN
ncbi:MAG: hypothetical protein LC799_25190 [Actinobacteria bacterium]|nr:hypothetical protein [Actinomycetota bacterium]